MNAKFNLPAGADVINRGSVLCSLAKPCSTVQHQRKERKQKKTRYAGGVCVCVCVCECVCV